ncbi:hypothetical protein MP228_011776 [Amoeboaphelidium protococcarum]|nr:hypothetical protein MP228_011776 [Amoeboaphelidium protococcarum]
MINYFRTAVLLAAIAILYYSFGPDSDVQQVARRGLVQESLIDYCVDKSQFAFSFDDGPQANTDKILAALKKVGGQATFHVATQYFFNPEYAKLVKKAYDSNHIIGLRFPPDLDPRTMSEAEFTKILYDESNKVYNIIKAHPVFFRMRADLWQDRLVRLAKRMEFIPIGFTQDAAQQEQSGIYDVSSFVAKQIDWNQSRTKGIISVHRDGSFVYGDLEKNVLMMKIPIDRSMTLVGMGLCLGGKVTNYRTSRVDISGQVSNTPYFEDAGSNVDPYVNYISYCPYKTAYAFTFSNGFKANVFGMLEALNAVGGKATFFFDSGYFSDPDFKAMVLRAYEEDHTVGLRFPPEVNLETVGDKQFAKTLFDESTKVKNIIGFHPVFLKMPRAFITKSQLKITRDMGFEIVQNNIDAGDQSLQDSGSIQQVIDIVKNAVDQNVNKDRGLISLHNNPFSLYDNKDKNVQLLRIPVDKGYKLVNMAMCVGGRLPPYTPNRQDISGSLSNTPPSSSSQGGSQTSNFAGGTGVPKDPIFSGAIQAVSLSWLVGLVAALASLLLL